MSDFTQILMILLLDYFRDPSIIPILDLSTISSYVKQSGKYIDFVFQAFD